MRQHPLLSAGHLVSTIPGGGWPAGERTVEEEGPSLVEGGAPRRGIGKEERASQMLRWGWRRGPLPPVPPPRALVLLSPPSVLTLRVRPGEC